jgi:hypothetical protein
VATTTERPEKLAEEWLAAAYELVERGWCQGAPARDGSERPVEPDSPAAQRWSATGALTRIWRQSDAADELGLGALQFANLALSAAVNHVPKLWNDMPDRRHQEVLEALIRAVSLVQDPALFGDGNGRAARGKTPEPAAD